MIQGFKGRKPKDIETAAETVIPNISFAGMNSGRLNMRVSDTSITGQQLSTDNFDTSIEKRK